MDKQLLNAAELDFQMRSLYGPLGVMLGEIWKRISPPQVKKTEFLQSKNPCSEISLNPNSTYPTKIGFEQAFPAFNLQEFMDRGGSAVMLSIYPSLLPVFRGLFLDREFTSRLLSEPF